jgi:hypothetical protein
MVPVLDKSTLISGGMRWITKLLKVMSERVETEGVQPSQQAPSVGWLRSP